MTISAQVKPQFVSLMVQRKVIGPPPAVCVNVALGVLVLGLNVPETPPRTDHPPTPVTGVLPRLVSVR